MGEENTGPGSIIFKDPVKIVGGYYLLGGPVWFATSKIPTPAQIEFAKNMLGWEWKPSE